LIKVVSLFDAHVGWVKVPKNGQLVTKRTHNPKALKAALAFVEDFAPDVVILGGDQLNAGPVSHWNSRKPRLTEGFRLKKELDELNELLLSHLDGIPDKRWLTGNHEAWIDQFLEEHPGLEGMISPKDYLDLEGLGWKFFDQYQLTNIGKLFYCHGENATTVHHAKKMLDLYKKCIRYGHRHTAQTALASSMVDEKDKKDAKAIPCLCDLNPDYSYNNPNNWVNGFQFAYVFPDGSFTDYVVTMIDNRFVVDGKVYDGRRM
jgi:hypothetical protein